MQAKSSDAVSTLFGPGSLRLILACLVVVHHSTNFNFGKFAVFAFFILSGYWIPKAYSEKYVRSVTAENIFRFYLIRWWRILPLFVICTGVSLIIFYGLGTGLSPTTDWPALAWKPLMKQFALPVLNYFGGFALAPAWSLDVELQFYLLIPLLMMSRWLRLSAWVFPFIVMGINLVHPLPETFFSYSIFFVLGMAIFLNDWRPSPRLVHSALAVTLLMAAAKLIYFPAVYQNWDGLMAIAFAPVIGWNVRTISRHDKLFGDLSYSLYLFHWIPVYYLRQRLGYNAGHEWTLTDTPAILLSWAASLGGALILLFVVDLPSEKLRYRLTKRSLKRPVVMPPL